MCKNRHTHFRDFKSNVHYFIFIGVATAFAARDILGNVLSGLSVQLSQPFSIGDTIKVCQ